MKILVISLLVFCSIPSGLVLVAQRHDTPFKASESSLRAFLGNYLKELSVEEDNTTRYLGKWIDLNGDGKQEAVVYVMGQDWCGSGGCTTLVIEPSETSYKVITKMTITSLPISMVTTSSHGWHNLTIWVRRGGILEPYEAELEFNGKSYPRNPTVSPVRHYDGKAKQEVLIPDNVELAKPLYP